jgi:outer membrane protein assembly factor BamB
VQIAVAVGNDTVLATTADGRMLRIAGKDRQGRQWQLSGRITSGPQIAGGRVVLVTDRRQVVSLDPQAPPEMKAPNWTFGPFAGRICGAPVAAGEQLVVTDEGGLITGGQITGLDAKTGDVLWRMRLGKGAVPAAAAVPIGPGRLLVPLRDGAVMQCPLPPATPEKVAGVET